MTSRYIRDTVVALKIETTSGTDAVPTGGANAMQVSNVKLTPLNAQFVSRDLIRNYFGAPEELIGAYNALISFDIELVGSGTAGTAPAWGPALRACGWAETLVSSERVYYTPITNGQESVSIYCADSGVLHKCIGAKGAASIMLKLGGIPKISYAFVALYGGPATGTLSGVDFSAFMQPQVVQNAFSGDITMGATLVGPGATPALTGGTLYPSQGIEIDTGVKAEYIDLLGGEGVDIVDRNVKGKISLSATAAQEVAFYNAIKSGTLQSLGFIHGTVVGRRVGIFGASTQNITPALGEFKGRRMLELDVGFKPVDGNDELTLITSF